jgi:uncharacterized protein YaaQ
MGETTRESTAAPGALFRRLAGRQALKLVVAIVQEDDADSVVRELVESGLPVTKIASTGGFLRAGNATLLIGVGGEELPRVKEIIQAKCLRREVPISASVDDKAVVGGAVVFVVSLEELVKF